MEIGLQSLIGAWPFLPQPVQGGIYALVLTVLQALYPDFRAAGLAWALQAAEPPPADAVDNARRGTGGMTAMERVLADVLAKRGAGYAEK